MFFGCPSRQFDQLPESFARQLRKVAVAKLASPARGKRRVAACEIGTVPFTGFGLQLAPLKFTNSRQNSRHRRPESAHRRNVFVRTLAAPGERHAMASNSSASQPTPIPSDTRPSVRWSSVAISSPTPPGCYAAATRR